MAFPIIPTIFRIVNCADAILLIVTKDNDDGGEEEEGGENEDEFN